MKRLLGFQQFNESKEAKETCEECTGTPCTCDTEKTDEKFNFDKLKKKGDKKEDKPVKKGEKKTDKKEPAKKGEKPLTAKQKLLPWNKEKS